jgi:hypothetical protein
MGVTSGCGNGRLSAVDGMVVSVVVWRVGDTKSTLSVRLQGTANVTVLRKRRRPSVGPSLSKVLCSSKDEVKS